jgi:hypothetical protein
LQKIVNFCILDIKTKEKGPAKSGVNSEPLPLKKETLKGAAKVVHKEQIVAGT